MSQPILGIDIAKATFAVCLRVDCQTWQATFENSPSGFKALSQWTAKRTAEPVRACLEATGRYGEALAEYLYQAGAAVSVVNPARIKAYARCLLRRNKTDQADAVLISQYCQREQPALWSPPPLEFKALQALVRRWDDLQAMYRQEHNRLLSGSHPAGVQADLQEHLQELKQRLERLEQAIQAHIQAHASLKRRQVLLLSIPGIGKRTAAHLLGEIRDITAFSDARQLAAYAGLTPRNFSSGTSVNKPTRLSKTGNALLRKALYLPAVVAKRYNPIIHAFCQRLLQAGLKPMQVIGAAMRKLLHLVYGVLKSGKPFDPHFLEKQPLTS